jgi:RND superfamily putative drug exporter
MLNRWTRAVVRHRTLVIVGWLALALLGLATSGALDSRLSTSLSVPGTESAQANVILAAHFHENVEGSFTIVVPTDSQSAASIERRASDAVRTVPTGQVLQAKQIGAVVYLEADTNMNLVRAAAWTGRLRQALGAQGLAGAMVTGPAALQSDVTPVLRSDLRRGELIALLLALVVLIAVLGLCAAVAVPFVVAAATISTSLLVVYLLAHVVLMVLYVPNVLELIGLGLAIDYSLLIVHRFRAEMRNATSTTEAVVSTMDHAGRTVVISGAAVGVGLATLMLVPVPFLRSLGAAGIVVPLVSILSALTLQPVLLSLLGARGLRSVGVRGLMGERDRLASGWTSTTRAVLRHPRLVMGVALVLVAACAGGLWWLQLTPGTMSAIPASLPSAQADLFMDHHVGPGVITPVQVVAIAPVGEDWRSPALQRLQTRLGTVILAEREVADVAIGITTPYVDPSGRYTQIFVVAHHQFGAETTQQLVTRIRQHDVAAAALPRGFQVVVGGAAAQGVDFLDRTYGAFPWIVALAMASAVLILWRAFRSLTLAVLAVLFDLVSVAAAYGVMVAVFRFGFAGSLLGTYRIDQIEGWVPVFIFAMLFGLSMDYEVFIVTRVREARRSGLGSSDAIVTGLAQTGGVVSAAALIMVAALSGLALGHIAGLQELGVGLAAGVLIDATVVRGLILPASLELLGERSWR